MSPRARVDLPGPYEQGVPKFKSRCYADFGPPFKLALAPLIKDVVQLNAEPIKVPVHKDP